MDALTSVTGIISASRFQTKIATTLRLNHMFGSSMFEVGPLLGPNEEVKMLRRLIPYLGPSALGLAAFLVVAEPVAAQHSRNRGRGFSIRYSPGYGIRAGYYTGRHSPYYGRHHAPRYYRDSYGSRYRQSYGRSHAPALYYGYGEEQRVSRYPREVNAGVRFSVRVPAVAEIWIDGAKMTQTGSLRRFVSPRISSGRMYTYSIRARWIEGGQVVDQTRKVSFHAGDQLTVNFLTPPSAGSAELRAAHHEER